MTIDSTSPSRFSRSYQFQQEETKPPCNIRCWFAFNPFEDAELSGKPIVLPDSWQKLSVEQVKATMNEIKMKDQNRDKENVGPRSPITVKSPIAGLAEGSPIKKGLAVSPVPKAEKEQEANPSKSPDESLGEQESGRADFNGELFMGVYRFHNCDSYKQVRTGVMPTYKRT